MTKKFVGPGQFKNIQHLSQDENNNCWVLNNIKIWLKLPVNIKLY